MILFYVLITFSYSSTYWTTDWSFSKYKTPKIIGSKTQINWFKFDQNTIILSFNIINIIVLSIN